MQKIDLRNDSFNTWTDARRYGLVVWVAVLPFLVAPVALTIVSTLLFALGVRMFDIVYFLAAGASAYLSVVWSTAIAPRRRWHLARALSLAYWVIAIAALVLVLLLDQHPYDVLDENEMLEILALGGLGMGGLGGYAWATGAQRHSR
jgi:hypothetical protein